MPAANVKHPGPKLRPIKFQDDAAAVLSDRAGAMLDRYPDRRLMRCVLQAGVGSGKTLMAAETIKRLRLTHPDCVFVWVSVRDLHTQSQRKLERYLADSDCSTLALEDIIAQTLAPGTILFGNFESLTRRKNGKWTSVASVSGENGLGLLDVLERTRRRSPIILLWDEKHIHDTPQTQAFIDEISPTVIVEMTATPKTNVDPRALSDGSAFYHEVKPEEVAASGLIVSDLIINPGVLTGTIPAGASLTDYFLDQTMTTRAWMQRRYREESIRVNPLGLIQLPSDQPGMSAADVTACEHVEAFFRARGVTAENGKLAFWLANDKRNLDGIEANLGTVEFLVFKVAAATGWDCPRAKVWLKLRTITSETFHTQTEGRVKRTPEGKLYGISDLDRAYVFTLAPDIAVVNEPGNLNHSKDAEARVVHPLPVELPSVYGHRTDYNDLTSDPFMTAFARAVTGRFDIDPADDLPTRRAHAAQHLDLDVDDNCRQLVAETLVDANTYMAAQADKFTYLKTTIDAASALARAQAFMKKSCRGYGTARSWKKIQRALHEKLFGLVNDSALEVDEFTARLIVCSAANQQVLTALIEDAKDIFAELKGDRSVRVTTENLFNIPAVDYFASDLYEEVRQGKYAADPCWLEKDRLTPERDFEYAVDRNAAVASWYKNGAQQARYFAVPYLKAERDRLGHRLPGAFYVDYIVVFHDGTVGLYDTKAGASLAEAGPKAKGLYDYITAHNQQAGGGPRLRGGIVRVRDHQLSVCEGPKFAPAREELWLPVMATDTAFYPENPRHLQLLRAAA